MGQKLTLIYSGQGALARSFFEWAWPNDAKSREIFWREFADCQLVRSNYYRDIMRFNRWPAKERPQDCIGWGEEG
ncbi:MAG: hypothetical protein EXQ89_06155 [Rhodospirillaceae bacterium]|nr:hypothetical protein [Rhodospirillaceae bacterium]